ncbi:hypothetical protein [Amycolatopsis sp. SID8362]|uniref:hypothetical protein n=1 Tax=Amycolatopsis sp. SID8362 TaxID=2690346 RepID=UPI001368E0D9|nr:hypothetical protein [Amycolatopsis sp. SID8362]NBH10360.1 hypothetical protein [Amycolatopsis sp. SID8362]NED47055.1 hypothetical protein [Amycolatopsis sp. SID8362]
MIDIVVAMRSTSPQLTGITREDFLAPAPQPPEFYQRAVELVRLGDKPVAAWRKNQQLEPENEILKRAAAYQPCGSTGRSSSLA